MGKVYRLPDGRVFRPVHLTHGLAYGTLHTADGQVTHRDYGIPLDSLNRTAVKVR